MIVTIAAMNPIIEIEDEATKLENSEHFDKRAE